MDPHLSSIDALHTGTPEDWRDIVNMYELQINNIAIEDNYANISQEEIKKAYLKHDKWRKPHKKTVKSWLHMLSLICNILL